MIYRNKKTGREVKVSKIEDGYVYFVINGLETIVAEKRFLKMYKEKR
jgi:hypothetical protein